MKRRAFNRHLFSAAVAAPLAVTASATKTFGDGQDGHYGLRPYDRVVLRTNGVTTRIRRFLLMTDDGFHVTNLRLSVPQMAAERFDLGDVPFLGEVLTPTLKRQFSGAAEVGTLHLYNSDIVMLPFRSAAALHGQKVWITHRGVVYQPTAKLRPMHRTQLLSVELVMSAPVIGKAVLKGDIVLAIVTPSVLDEFSFGDHEPASLDG